MHSSVFVETRPIPNLETIIHHHLDKLNDNWDLTIFHGENEHLFQRIEARKIKLPKTTDYNRLLTSRWFWEQIPHEKILIFQHDSGLLRSGIDQFLEWDWVGAPWKEKPGGNGGLSIRSKKAMLAVIDKYGSVKGNEDLWFCKYLPRLGFKLAPRRICEEFSCETMFRLGTLGYHAIDKYLTPQQCKNIRNQYKVKL